MKQKGQSQIRISQQYVNVLVAQWRQHWQFSNTLCHFEKHPGSWSNKHFITARMPHQDAWQRSALELEHLLLIRHSHLSSEVLWETTKHRANDNPNLVLRKPGSPPSGVSTQGYQAQHWLLFTSAWRKREVPNSKLAYHFLGQNARALGRPSSSYTSSLTGLPIHNSGIY